MSATRESRWSSAAPGLAAFGAVVLAIALAVSSGMYSPVALALVSIAGAAALVGTFASADHSPGTGRRATIGILALGIGTSWVHDLLFLPGVAVDPAALGAFRPALVVVGVILLTYFWRGPPGWVARTRFPVIVALGIALAALVILASPSPGIDVWQIQQQGATALLSGRNPYALAYPNPYGPGTPFLDPSILSSDGLRILAYPYMPLVLLLDVPGVLLGDVRWTMLVGLAISALLVRALGRGSLEAELAGALLLLQPQGWMVIELAWTEPLALAAVLLVALTVTRTASRAGDGSSAWKAWLVPGLAAALAISTKQYVPLLLVSFLFLLPRAACARSILVAAAGATALALPFLAIEPRAFVRGVLEFQLRQPFRQDALSWPAALFALGGPKSPSWPAFVLAGATLVATLRGSMTIGRATLASASAWIVFVAFNKQAFANYYWMGVGLLCAGVAVLTPSPPNGRSGTGNGSR